MAPGMNLAKGAAAVYVGFFFNYVSVFVRVSVAVIKFHDKK